MDAAARPTSEYELLPPQGNAQHATGGAATTGSHNENADAEASSRRSSLSASSGEFEYMAGGISMLPDTHYGPDFGISPASSIRSSSSSRRRRSLLQEDDSPEEHASSSEYHDDDYVSVSRASSDVGVYPTADGIRRSLEAAAEGQQSAETLVEDRGGAVPQVDDEVVVVAEKDGGGVLVEAPTRPWTPFYLQRTTLLGFALVYVVLLVALVVLGAFDQKNQGLATSKSSRHYLWTYGPTAVLTIVAALWGQVEHRTKQMMPWEILRKGPSPAADTLLLDYVEPARLTSLWVSLKKAHWPVSIAIVGTLLLQLLTVVSTGLFQLQSEMMNHTGVALLYGDEFALEPSNNFAVGAAPVLSAIALSNGNLSYPAGTSENIAFPALSLKHNISDAQNLSISSTVDVFHAELGCEVVQDPQWNDDCFVGSSFYGDCKSAMPKVSFNTSSCQIKDLEAGLISGTSQAGVYGVAVTANCTNAPSDNRLVIAMIRYGIGRNYTGEYPENSSPELSMEPAPILLCKPSYAIDSRDIVMDGSGKLVSAGPQNSSTSRGEDQLPIQQWDLVTNILDSVNNASNAASGPANEIQDIGSDGSTRSALDSFMYCLVAFLNPNNITDLLDIDLLQKESERFYNVVSAQMAKDYLMVPSDREVSGDVTADQQRLRIRGLSFYMMEAILAVLIVIAAALYFLAPRNNTSRDPGSIGGLAAIMAESPSLYQSLSRCGSASISTLRNRLSTYSTLSFMQLSGGRPEFRVVMAPGNPVAPVRTSDAESGEDKIRWWKPLAMSRVTKTGVTLYLLLLIAALESTYQASIKHDGLADVETESYVRYTWSYIPALSMFIAQLLVGMIGDMSKIFAPFHELRRKGPVPAKALFSDPLSHVTIQTVFTAIPTKQFALLAMSLAMLLTPLLTIVASGLFSPETSGYTQAVTAKLTDAFNLTDATISMQSAFVIGLLLQSNLSYPAWTYGELALPQLRLDTIQQTGQPINASAPSFNSSTINLIIPAPRASLNCTYLPPGDVYVYTEADVSDFTQAATPSLASNNSDCTALYSTLEGNFSRPFGWTQSVIGDCGYIRGVYGPSTADNATAQGFACVPSIEQVQVNLTLRLPGYDVVDAVALEGTAEPFEAAEGWDWNNFDLADILPGAGYTDASTNETSSSAAANDTTTATASQTLADFDTTFQAILDSAPNITAGASDLFGPDAFPRVANSLQHVFRLAFAQVVNREFRVGLSSSSSSPSSSSNTSSASPSANADQATIITATLTNPHRLRLKQSPLSTRLLEGLLAAITVCLVVGCALMDDVREVLPKNPCSVAAAASLVADAGM
ncbi:hypothetical protein DIS24_g10987, partial [Lasiodiplodia hormozganensis]